MCRSFKWVKGGWPPKLLRWTPKVEAEALFQPKPSPNRSQPAPAVAQPQPHLKPIPRPQSQPQPQPQPQPQLHGSSSNLTQPPSFYPQSSLCWSQSRPPRRIPNPPHDSTAQHMRQVCQGITATEGIPNKYDRIECNKSEKVKRNDVKMTHSETKCNEQVV